MKHFKTEDWVDFVNQVTNGSQNSAMQKHLDNGCERCSETATLWQKVRNSAAKEASYQPPVEAVRIAKASFAIAGFTSKPQKTDSLIEVLFDSFLQPVVAGARSTASGVRQMLYRADPYQVDVQIEAKPEGNRLMITGQLLDVSRPTVIGSEILVTISNLRGSVTHTMTNQFGEFRGEIDNTGDLQLSFPCPGEKPIVISLRDALSRLAGGKS